MAEQSTDIEKDVSEFVRLDDENKQANKDLKKVRDEIKNRKGRIIEFMKAKNIDRFSIKNNTQVLECCEKTLKRRATQDQIRAKLTELMTRGVNDPQVIMNELASCGGTVTEHRLFRRARRVNTTATKVAAAAVNKARKLRKRRNVVQLKMSELKKQ